MSSRLGRLFAMSLFAIGTCYGQEQSVFSLPGSVLVFANPDFELRIATDRGTHKLKPPARRGAFNYPSLALDGSRVAWGFAAADTQASGRRHFTLGVSSIVRPEWKTYGDFEDVGAAAISADGSKVAFSAVQSGRKSSFLILNSSTGEIETIPELSKVTERAALGWSPDGAQLVVEVKEPDQPAEIFVADLHTRELRIIGTGVDPAWSPTGEWIVYSDIKRQKCILVHPDGTKARVVRDLTRNLLQNRIFAYGPVWSPTGKQLLLNEMKGEGPNIDVMLLDIATGKVTRKLKNGLAAFGWAKERQ